MSIYAAKIWSLYIVVVVVSAAWGIFNYEIEKRDRKNIIISSAIVVAKLIFLLVSVYAILRYTVIGREISERRVFILSSDPGSGEFFREMFMNALLYFPLGLSLSVFVGPRAILAGLVMSVSIESWQYFAGTGLAQVTDVVLNALGVAIGTAPYMTAKIALKLKKRKHDA